jgi:hypothetical protein
MRWKATHTLVPGTAASAMVRIATGQPSRRLRWGVPISAATGVTGLCLVLAPAVAERALFQLLLLPVLAAALGLGLSTALLMVLLSGVVGSLALRPFGMPGVDDPLHLAGLALFVAEGAMIAFIGAIVRAAIGTALRSAPTAANVHPPVSTAPPRVGPLLRRAPHPA